MTENYFCVRQKNKRKLNQHFEQLFFMISVHFGISNLLSKYRKTNLLLINSVYLAFFSRGVQRRVIQTKVYHKFFYFVWKETTHKPSTHKSIETAKKLFSSVYLIGTTCFNKLFYSCDNWKTLFFIKAYCYPEALSHRHVLWNKSFEIGPYFNFYLHNTNTKVKVKWKYQSSKMELLYTILKTLTVLYSFLPNCKWGRGGGGESNKMHQPQNYQDFLKWELGLFLGHSLIIIKWTWGVFSQNLQFDPPLPTIVQLCTKE